MKSLFKLFFLFLLICVALYIFSGISSAAICNEGRSLNFLLVGFDSSPANTDVLSVVSYDNNANTVRVVQIPRDTCIDYGGKKGKINGYYSYSVMNGQTHKEALSSLSDKISTALGIRLDGYVSLTQQGLADVVDFMGGVSVNVTDVGDALGSEFEKKNGKIFLDGKAALDFVRYRKKYLRGDLERLDAQKIFLKALFNKLRDGREIFSLLKFISDSDEFLLEFDKGRSLSFAIENFYKIPSADFQMATLPGKAQKYGQVWYYIVNRAAAEAQVDGYFPYKTEKFDIQNVFVYDM